jgi:hypothetical protein
MEHEAMTLAYTLLKLAGTLRFIAQARAPADLALSALQGNQASSEFYCF